ncbi:ATP-binding protein [Chitinophaga rhizosphaerae]|uniref:ATP-binding protein n=1 Tax=Chitinophaga rhizosphaerae TaxID=1864947 RepID=UPI000F80CB8C|nr:ATP-binding protein [Chitinophaga rhizosphaerae]
MDNLQSSATIVSLLKETPKPVILLGAGASVTSGIPLASEVVSKAARWAYARQNGKNPDDPRITKSDWYPWLTNQTWFKEDAYLADLFPDAVENLLQPQKIRKEFWIKILNPDVPISTGYLRLVELMHLKKISNVLTTNFDDCLPKARNLINRPHHIDIIKSPDDYTKISSNPQYPCLIYLHGAVENYTDKNVIEEVSKMDNNLVENLLPILKDCPLIVIGYRGSEPSVMDHLLINNAEKAFNFKNGIYWCIKKGESPENMSSKVKTLAQTIGSNFQLVEIESFDHLFDKVVGAHLEEKRIDLPQQFIAPAESMESEPKNFDLRAAKKFDENDVDKSLLRDRIINYCQKLNINTPPTITDQWLLNQMQYLNLVRELSDKSISITNAGILLFGKAPHFSILNSRIKIRFIGEEYWLRKILDNENIDGNIYEESIEGNLWIQLNKINDALATINKPFRLKNEKSENVLPYDPIALKEVIVNSIVHRDYEESDENIIEIYPNRIVIKNPGGLIDEVKTYFEDSVMQEEIKRGMRGIKGYRNPVLADLFYSSGDMDKKGSGLYDVIMRSQANSGAVEFYANENNTLFTVCMWCRPEAIDDITNTASPLTVISTRFYTNIIEIKEIPSRVYFSNCSFRDKKEVYATYDQVTFPPFQIFQGKAFSFSNLDRKNNPLRNIINIREIDSWALDEFLAQPEGEKQFVAILNDYIRGFLSEKGLIVDPIKKRAYYPKKQTDEERTISYQARFKKATRTIVKPKYSVNKDRIRYWEHKGFNYSIKKFDSDWSLLIEPTYIFTLDGVKRLFAPLKVGALATKKASRDYNLHVLNDIIFWMWVLTNGSSEDFKLNKKEIIDLNLEDNITLSCEYLKTSINNIENAELISDKDSYLDMEDLEEEIASLAEQEFQDDQKETE